ncbi:MAG: hypothetical protein ABIX01_00105 [Chitinophagaceae bacterium]
MIYSKSTYIKGAIYAPLMLLLTILTGCSFTNSQPAIVKKMILVVNYPNNVLIKKKLTNDNILDTIFIYNSNGFTIYKLPPHQVLETYQRLYGTEPIFIFKKGSKNGCLLGSILDASAGRQLPVDSILAANAFADVKFVVNPTDSLVETIDNGHSGQFIEKFVPRADAPKDYFDSVFHYYSKSYTSLDYTFSPILDSIKGMKLYRIRLMYNEKYSEKYKITLPKREYLFNIEPLDITQSDDKIKRLFEQVKANASFYHLQ